MTKRTALVWIAAAFLAGGMLSNWVDTEAILDRDCEIQELRDENRELISLLEEGR